MTHIEKLARKMYEAYRAHTGGKSLATGHDIPSWEHLPSPIKGAWCASAVAALDGGPPPDGPGGGTGQ